jgi:tetratricopeptide (TPR) repeat protein
MRRFALTFLALACLLVCAHAASAKDTWTSVRSKNFLLVGNASEKDIRQVATRLEQFRDAFSRLFATAKFTSPVPTTVVVFKSDSAYKPFKPVVDGKTDDNIAGYFQPGEEVNYITLTSEKREEDPFAVIYHEYVHQIVANTLGVGSVPPWFNEGLAEYYSTFEFREDRKVMLGNLIERHLQLLRQSKFIPLKQLLEVNDYSLDRNNKEAKWVFYAESWALVHYLIQGNGGSRLPQLNKFLTLFAQHKPTDEAFAEAFQTDIPAMEKELRKYVEGHSFAGQVATFQQKLAFDSEMQAAPLTDAEAEAYLGDLLLHTNRPDDAAVRLEHALQLDPKLATAHASLGMTRLRQHRFDEAKEQLRQAIEGGAQNYLAHYYYAYVLSRSGMDETGRVNGYDAESLGAMRASLLKSIELKPDFPESYHLLAFVDLVTGDRLDEGVEMLNRARALSPGNTKFALVLAQLYLRQQKYDAALKTVEPLAHDNAEPQMRANAQTIISEIKMIQAQAAQFKARQEAAEKGGGDDEKGDSQSDSQGPPRLVHRKDLDAGGGPQQAQSGKSSDESPEEAFTSSLNDALRKPLAGETRLLGTLTRIECSGGGLVFTVEAGGRTLRLTSRDFDSLQIVAYTPQAGSQLSCGPRKLQSRVVVTFRAAKVARAKSDGEMVALEFVPDNFKLRQ